MQLGLIVESVVAVLLVITIGYCWTLNKRLKGLRSDEASLRATIGELITATEIAERAIMGLKSTAGSADRTLGVRLGEAEAVSKKLSEQLDDGEEVLGRIDRVAEKAKASAKSHSEAPKQRQEAQQHNRQQEKREDDNLRAPLETAPEFETSYTPRKRVTSDLRRAANETASRLEQYRRRAGGRSA
ncbi:DUF6468 domain-containing protein [Polycladidibacter stylochi]|uniref:DUF6468 domain-containing protein n=1 Tax=Polycladidibacter stylochi TaxID=1807766 RepID=UPI000833B805|nr:DUF6468 domain-containing protein [Pseudovibrio stylochi]